MDRRTFLAGPAAALLAAPLAAGAQQVRKVAFLCPMSCSNLPHPVSASDKAFIMGLGRIGFPGGENVYFDMAGAGVGYDRLAEMATRLVSRKADVILAFGNAATRAARQATTTIPIVMVGVADPVEDGLIRSLAKPGRNVTGLAMPYEQLIAKHIELLREIRPALAQVAVVWNPGIERRRPNVAGVETALRGLGVRLHLVEARDARDLEKAFATVPTSRADALLVLSLWITPRLRSEIALFALQRRLLSVASDRFFVEAGGLMSYGPDFVGLYERAAVYTGKLLQGAKPHDLPVEEPTRFELIVSSVTAKALGLTIPRSLLSLADEVIQ